MLDNVNSIIEALGGEIAAASLLGVSRGTIVSWGFRGAIPARRFFDVKRELEARGLVPDRKAFNFVEVRP